MKPFKLQPIKFNMSSTFKPIHFKLDIDRDGVFDWKDCRPFNSRLQDDLSEMHTRVLTDALKKYSSPHQMENDIKEWIDLFVDDEFPYTDIKIKWWDSGRNIIYIYDKPYGVEHYILRTSHKNYPCVGLVTKLKNALTDKQTKKLIDWSYENARMFLGWKK